MQRRRRERCEALGSRAPPPGARGTAGGRTSRTPVEYAQAAERRGRDRAAGSVSDMTGVDWIIVGLLLLLALFGWAQGFVTGALALIGFALGAWLGTRLAGRRAARRLAQPVRARDRAGRRAVPRRRLRGGLRGAGLPAALEADAARLRLRRRRPRRAADRVRRARRGVDPRRGRGPLERRGPLRGPALGDPLAAQQGAAAVRAAAERARALRPVPEDRRPGGERGAAREGHRPRPAGAGGRGQRREDPRARRAGSASRARAGSRATASSSPTRTWWRARPTPRCCCAARGRSSTRPRSPSTRATTSRCCGSAGSRRPALPLADSPGPGRSAAILGFPENGPYDVRAGRLGADAHDA